MPDLTWGQLPRVPMLDAENIPVPESGYVGAGEVMERLLYAWWGASADEPSGYIDDEPVEPPRVCRRLQLLRRWSYDETDLSEIFTGSARACRADGA